MTMDFILEVKFANITHIFTILTAGLFLVMEDFYRVATFTAVIDLNTSSTTV